LNKWELSIAGTSDESCLSEIGLMTEAKCDQKVVDQTAQTAIMCADANVSFAVLPATEYQTLQTALATVEPAKLVDATVAYFDQRATDLSTVTTDPIVTKTLTDANVLGSTTVINPVTAQPLTADTAVQISTALQKGCLNGTSIALALTRTPLESPRVDCTAQVNTMNKLLDTLSSVYPTSYANLISVVQNYNPDPATQQISLSQLVANTLTADKNIPGELTSGIVTLISDKTCGSQTLSVLTARAAQRR